MNIKNLLLEQHIPQKPYFKSSELPSLLKVKPHEISYWETVFPKLKNNRNKQGQKFYEREDVLMLLAIKHLLHDKKLTVAGTKKILAESYDMFAPNTAVKEDLVLEENYDLPNCSIAQYQADSTLYEASLILEDSNQDIKENIRKIDAEALRLKQEKINKLETLHSALKELLLTVQNFENKLSKSVLANYIAKTL